MGKQNLLVPTLIMGLLLVAPLALAQETNFIVVESESNKDVTTSTPGTRLINEIKLILNPEATIKPLLATVIARTDLEQAEWTVTGPEGTWEYIGGEPEPGTPEVRIRLIQPTIKFKELTIRLSGATPEVAKQTEMTFVNVTTSCHYPGGERPIKELELDHKITVTTAAIGGALQAIQTAKSKLSQAQRVRQDVQAALDEAKREGVDTARYEDAIRLMDSAIRTAESNIGNAERAYEEGNAEAAMAAANNASELLDDAILTGHRVIRGAEEATAWDRLVEKIGITGIIIVIVIIVAVALFLKYRGYVEPW
ncbi:MAG: hypothetical protein DRO11_05800 [Methanobacteriota archaeon]|nr:MAG: hypothetical protein DRO11_05800 [Euryarchaeota archaeon]